LGGNILIQVVVGLFSIDKHVLCQQTYMQDLPAGCDIQQSRWTNFCRYLCYLGYNAAQQLVSLQCSNLHAPVCAAVCRRVC
jgi:hypothetical protein